MNRAEQLRVRTRQFAVRIVRTVALLPKTPEAQVIGRQLLRSGTGLGSKYRSACRARSRAAFASRLAHVEEEADETVYRLELLEESRGGATEELQKLLQEARGLTAIFSASRKTARSNRSDAT